MNSRYNSEENKVGRTGLPQGPDFLASGAQAVWCWWGTSTERATPPDGQRPLPSEVALRMTAYSHCLWENCLLR